MRNLRNPQLERGEVRIEDIKLNHKCRDDMPTLLSGLQYLYSQEASRDRLFALLDEFILPDINKRELYIQVAFYRCRFCQALDSMSNIIRLEYHIHASVNPMN